MPRYARFHVTGGLFHIISRFHDRRFYLDVEGAREKYLELLGMAAANHDSRIIAYCLMSSHVHLVLQLGNDPLGRLTKQIHAPFGVWINKQRKGLGAIFADRPRTVLVHAETHGMALLRYVHNNPVRAGLVERASDSGWSSHRAYLGLEACPSWLATEAVFGDNESEVESLRHDFACFVDEGRNEGRIPEFSGEVSNAMARRIRKMIGGDVELSYPVLGPDEFVLSALKDQVHRHGERSRSIRKELTAEAVVRAVFKSMSLDPALASQATKVSAVSRGRALAALLWVEKLGNAQVVMADAMNLSFGAVAMMLNRLRKKGLTRGEKQLLARILGTLTKKEKRENIKSRDKAKNEPMAPKVVILKRQRR
jgi:putative transposase